MKSMTGFGRGAASGENFSVNIELKTVNNRFLDISLRLPSDLQALENNFKKLITARLSRGRVEVNFQFERSEETSYEMNRPVIDGYLSAMRQMQKEFSLTGEPDLNVLARLPNAFQVKRAELGDEFAAAVESALNVALDDLEVMRSSEGLALQTEFETRLSEIEKRLEPIESESANIADEYLQRLTRRIGEMLAKSESQIEIDQSRMAQEVAYLSDKADISEEISRLRTHVEHFRTIMKDDKEAGKRLDFLTQELNREANTITSKTSNMNVKENALAIKSEIEKIREQVQNVE
jgi:TIGR00255 family protein